MAEQKPALPDRSWFALLDVALVAGAGAAWYVRPELGAWPLAVALLPWLIRLLHRRFPFQRTPLDGLFLVFMLTAALGVWAGYDPQRAAAKFWLILDGVLMVYALAGQPRENRWWVAGGLGGYAVAISGYFFLTHDWRVDPGNLESLTRLGLAWMNLRPDLGLRALHPNVVAGMLVLTMPYLAATALQAWRKGRRGLAALPAGGLAFTAFALLMTSSRGGWIALIAAFGLWGLWAGSSFLAPGKPEQRLGTFLTVLSILALIGVVGVAASPGGLVGLLDRLPGPSSTGSRLALFQAMFFLIGDFPITGGGLDAFPGLYSHYILGSPTFILEHGHNLLLNITLEQGLAGGLAAFGILGVSAWLLIQGIRRRAGTQSSSSLLLWASLAGMAAVFIHGLVDDPLYGSRGQMLLWVAPGVALAVLSHGRRAADPRPPKAAVDPVVWLAAAGAAVSLGISLWAFRNPLQAAWFADLGALEMARIELSDFPTDRWDDGSEAEALLPVLETFEQAIRFDPDNRTAHHRYGLAAVLLRDFNAAIAYLEIAYEAAPDHPGIRKALAFAYAWAGDREGAMALLPLVPEARSELNQYVFYWRALGRDDLSQIAEALERNLFAP